MATITSREQFKNYCLDNKYTKWYFNLIENAEKRNWNKKTSNCYVEKHHTVPKSIIDNDTVVYLTAKEHLICHLLLTKMLLGKNKWKMQRALWNMSHTRDIKLNSSLYESIRTEYSKNCSKFMSGKNNPSYGISKKGIKVHSEQHKQLLRERMTGKNNPMYGKEYPIQLIEQRCKDYSFCFDGQLVEIHNLRKFCRDNMLDQGAMTRVNNNKQISHKGYSKWPQ